MNYYTNLYENAAAPDVTSYAIQEEPEMEDGLLEQEAENENQVAEVADAERPASENGSRAGSQSGSKPASQTGSRPASQAGSKHESQTGSRPGSQSGSRPVSKTGSKHESQTGSRPGSQNGSQPGSKTGSRPSSEAGYGDQGSKPASEKGSRPGSETGSRRSEKGSRPASETGSRKAGSRPSSRTNEPEAPDTDRPASGRVSSRASKTGSSRPGSGRVGSGMNGGYGDERPASGRVGSGKAASERIGSGKASRTSSARSAKSALQNGYGDDNGGYGNQGDQNGYGSDVNHNNYQSPDKYDEIFGRLDPEATGMIRRDDLVVALRLAGHNPTEQDVQRLLADKQDYEGVTLDEFRAMAGEKSLDTLRQELLEAFRVVDKGTGRVHRAILKALCGREDATISMDEIDELLEAANISTEDEMYSTEVLVELMLE